MFKDINFNELSLDNVGSWPLQLKLVIIAVSCVLLLTLGYWFDTRDQLVQLDGKKKDELEFLHQIESKQQTANNLPLYKKQLNLMHETFNIMLQKLPGNTEVPGLLEDINKAGISSGLSFRLFRPLPEKQQEFYAELPIEITVVGDYHQLGEFVSKVSSLNRIVTLHDYSIDRLNQAVNSQKPDENFAGTEKLVMNIMAKTYRYSKTQPPLQAVDVTKH